MGVVALTLLALMALLWLFQRNLIYLPDTVLAAPPRDIKVATVETGDGIELHPWIVPASGEAVGRVVVFNGNAGNRAHRLPLARALAERDLEVVLFDYRGYGDTAGSPSEEGLVRDGAAVARFASAHLPLVFFGESLGGAVAVEVAAEQPPAAMVLRSPFPSLADVAAVHYRAVPVRLLLRDRFEVEQAIAQVDVPVMVVLGEADSIVPPDLSRRVYEAAREPKRLIEMEGLDHNDPDLATGDELASAVRAFIDEHLSP